MRKRMDENEGREKYRTVKQSKENEKNKDKEPEKKK